ncbi:MAG: dihydrodipicolinate synthase family protein [Nanoarchaeota archaeon]
MNKINFSNALIPAVPTPLKEDGSIHLEDLKKYAKFMSKQAISGVALWVHTGRGLMLNKKQRELVIKTWKNYLANDKMIVCGVGCEYKKEITEDRYLLHTIEMAKQAIKYEADALLLYPPGFYFDKKNMHEKVINYHQLIAELDLPIILFYLYEEAGGIPYGFSLLDKLFAIDQVVAIKMATLDSVCTYQRVSNFIKSNYPRIQLITGEDRFFAYSLIRGAIGALVGLGAICPDIQKNMMNLYFANNYEKFIKYMVKVDKLAEAIFIHPMEGYIERLLYFLYLQGIIAKESVNDPFGPGINDLDKNNIKKLYKKICEGS